MRIAVVGASGIVGQKLIEVFNKKATNDQFLLFSSMRSAGKTYSVCGKTLRIKPIDAVFDNATDVAFFCTDADVSAKYIPRLAAQGTLCIDNSSYFRMHADVPLVVPEINGKTALDNHGIIANPNCVAIQTTAVLYPLNKHFGIRRAVITTFQAVSGGGKQAVEDYLLRRTEGNTVKLPHSIIDNVIPQIGDFTASGYTVEENKIMEECGKILSLDPRCFTCTAVRVPVYNCHSVCVNVQLLERAEEKAVFEVLNNLGLTVYKEDYPLPTQMDGKTEVAVARIRKDNSADNCFNLWIVADNLLKGAAYNAYQIAELIRKENYE